MSAVYAAIKGGIPTGTILNYPGTIAPAGFALCIGQTAMRSKYFNLIRWVIENDLIGENKLFGDGDGVSTFEFPDLREVVLVGSGKNERYVFDNTELDPVTGTNGTQAHDVYNVGEFKDDQFQGHNHEQYQATSNDEANWNKSYLISGWTWRNTRNITEMTGMTAPRYGTTTHGKQIGMNYIIRC